MTMDPATKDGMEELRKLAALGTSGNLDMCRGALPALIARIDTLEAERAQKRDSYNATLWERDKVIGALKEERDALRADCAAYRSTVAAAHVVMTSLRAEVMRKDEALGAMCDLHDAAGMPQDSTVRQMAKRALSPPASVSETPQSVPGLTLAEVEANLRQRGLGPHIDAARARRAAQQNAHGATPPVRQGSGPSNGGYSRTPDPAPSTVETQRDVTIIREGPDRFGDSFGAIVQHPVETPPIPPADDLLAFIDRIKDNPVAPKLREAWEFYTKHFLDPVSAALGETQAPYEPTEAELEAAVEAFRHPSTLVPSVRAALIAAARARSAAT